MTNLIERVRRANPYAVITTLARDVPWTTVPENVILRIEPFDLVLVAGPEEFALFSDAFSTSAIKDRIKHVGFFVEEVPAESENAGREILISAGGFFPGRAFFEDALRGLAQTRGSLRDKPIRLQVGHVELAAYDELRTGLLRLAAELELRIAEIHRGIPSDTFRQYMVDAALLILVPGLNNVLEAVRAGKAVVAVSVGDTLYEFRERMAFFQRKASIETKDPRSYVAVAWESIAKNPQKYAELLNYAHEHPHPEKRYMYAWDAPRVCADILWGRCMEAAGFAQIRKTLDKAPRGRRGAPRPASDGATTRWDQIQRDRTSGGLG